MQKQAIPKEPVASYKEVRIGKTPLSRDKRVFRRKGPWQDAGAACGAPRHDRAGRPAAAQPCHAS